MRNFAATKRIEGMEIEDFLELEFNRVLYEDFNKSLKPYFKESSLSFFKYIYRDAVFFYSKYNKIPYDVNEHFDSKYVDEGKDIGLIIKREITFEIVRIAATVFNWSAGSEEYVAFEPDSFISGRNFSFFHKDHFNHNDHIEGYFHVSDFINSRCKYRSEDKFYYNFDQVNAMKLFLDSIDISDPSNLSFNLLNTVNIADPSNLSLNLFLPPDEEIKKEVFVLLSLWSGSLNFEYYKNEYFPGELFTYNEAQNVEVADFGEYSKSKNDFVKQELKGINELLVELKKLFQKYNITPSPRMIAIFLKKGQLEPENEKFMKILREEVLELEVLEPWIKNRLAEIGILDLLYCCAIVYSDLYKIHQFLTSNLSRDAIERSKKQQDVIDSQKNQNTTPEEVVRPICSTNASKELKPLKWTKPANVIELNTIYQSLDNNGYLKCGLKKFKDLFFKENVDPVEWEGTNTSLIYFFDLLISTKKIEVKQKVKWKTLQSKFIYDSCSESQILSPIKKGYKDFPDKEFFDNLIK